VVELYTIEAKDWQEKLKRELLGKLGQCKALTYHGEFKETCMPIKRFKFSRSLRTL
jgi:hypothetical protein